MTDFDTTARTIAGRYLLENELGRGGMGVVWRAQDVLLQRPVAIKEVQVPPGIPEEERAIFQERVLREARAAARLSHRAVVTVYDVIEEGGHTFIVMELVDAPSLAALVARDGTVDPSRAASIAIDLTEALATAHRAGIVHRDVKPANVMCPRAGSVKLADFGVATVKGDPKITSTGLVLGSPAYMAPEQAQGLEAGPATDLWGLGATLYFAVEGRPPFDHGQAIPTLTAVVHDPPEPPSHAGELGPIISALLSKESSDRPAVEALLTQLRSVATGHASAATDPLVGTETEIAMSPSPVVTGPGVTAPVPPEQSRVPARSRMAPRASRGRWVLTASLLVAALAVLIVSLGRDDRVGTQPRAGGNETATPDREPVIPSDWTVYEGPGGSSVGYPEAWKPEDESATRVDLTAPSGSYFRFAWTEAPGDDVLGTLGAIADAFGATHGGYEQLALEPTEFLGYEAALWEYTWVEGIELHGYNLQFVTGPAEQGGYGFALNLVTRGEDIPASEELLEAFKASFEPPSS